MPQMPLGIPAGVPMQGLVGVPSGMHGISGMQPGMPMMGMPMGVPMQSYPPTAYY